MKKHIASALRSLARRLDPPASQAATDAVRAVAIAKASTQFAGHGLTVNVYGTPTTSAATIAKDIRWNLGGGA